MRGRKRLFLACAIGVALVPAVPVVAQSPALTVRAVRATVDPRGGQNAAVVLAVAERSTLQLRVLAADGGTVLEQELEVDSTYRFVWSGSDAQGDPAPSGTYRLAIDCSCGGQLVSETVELQVRPGGGGGKPGGGGGGKPGGGDSSQTDPPSGLGVVAAQTNILSWISSPSSKVSAYRVYRSPDPDGPFQLLGETSTVTFEDAPTDPAIYWYQVSAVARRAESSPTDAVSSDNVHLTQVVGPDGGTLAPTTGTVRLKIPAGAVAADTTFTIDQFSTPPPPAQQRVAVSRSFEIGPSGTAFAVPATLQLRLDAPAGAPLPRNYPADTASVGYWTGTRWSTLEGAGVDTSRSMIEVPIEHLSLFGASGLVLPHGGYSLGSNLCGYCHQSHNAPGPTLHPYPTQRETCFQCHNSAQGQKVNEVQRVTFKGTWLPDERFRLTLHDLETADITFAADPAVTRANIEAALIDLPNVDGSSGSLDPAVDGVSVAGSGPFDVTFQNGQGSQDVPQMTGRSITSAAGTIGVTTTTPGIGIRPGATSDLLGAFGETWPIAGVSTRASSHPVAAPRDGFEVKCSDCHTAHKDPSDPQFAKLLRRPDGAGGWLYTLNGTPATTPIGDQFCGLSCHDSTSPYPAPFGDHDLSGRAHEQAAPPEADEIQEIGPLAAANEVQVVTVSGGRGGDTFTLTYTDGAGSCTTGSILHNASPAAVQAALEAIPCDTRLSGNVAVTGSASNYTITFVNDLARTNVQQLTGTGSAARVVVTITTPVEGRGGLASGEHFTLTFEGETTDDAAHPLVNGSVTAAQVDAALEALSTIGAGNVTVTGTNNTGPFTITFNDGTDGLGALARTDVSTITGTGLGTPPGTVTVTVVLDGSSGQVTGEIACLGCHDPHATDTRRLTSAAEETLCFKCHTQAVDNTSGGPQWTAPSGPGDPSNVWDAFTSATNVYSPSVQIYHHPVATDEQAGGARRVECVSCHNSHLADQLDGPGTSKVVDPTDVFQQFNLGWDFTSSYLTRGTNVDAFCMTCHQTPLNTAPLNATTAYTPGGPNVPYDVRMVDDGAHEEFASGYPGNHATPDAPGNYAGCAAAGVSDANCVITCTACHDSHGSSNAMILRDTIVPPDWQAYTITNATWAGGTVTLSYRDAAGRICSPGNTGGCSVSVGVPITVAGITPIGYNGSFTTTQSGLAPIQYALTPDPGAYVNGGTVAPPRSYTLTGWNGNMDTLPRQWCLTCHISRGSDHKSGSACTSCHRHDSGRNL